MNSYGQGVRPRQPATDQAWADGPARRPAVLTAAVVLAVLSAVAYLTFVVLALTTIAPRMILAELGLPDAELDALATALRESEEYQPYVVRSVTLGLFAVVILATVFAMRSAATWARVLFTVVAPLAAGVAALGMLDEDSAPVLTALQGAGVVLPLVVLVLVWLPASNAYARSRRRT